MLTRHAPACARFRAFTLVELIVVILVLGILAAVTVAGFAHVTARAQAAAATAELKELTTATVAAALLDQDGQVDRDDVRAALAGAGAQVSDGLSAAAWQLGMAADSPTRAGQLAVGFDHGDGAVNDTSGTRAALVVSTPDGRRFAAIVSAGGTVSTPAPLDPGAATTPLEVLGGTLPDAHEPPTGVSVQSLDGGLKVDWDAAAGATSYTVTASAGGVVVATATTTSTVATLTGLDNQVSYDVAVTAHFADGTTASTESAGEIVAVPMPAATGVTAVAGDRSVVVSWVAAPGASSYTVTARGDGQVAGPWSTSTGSVTATGLVNGTTYTFTVTAVYASGVRVDAAEVSAMPAAPALVSYASTSFSSTSSSAVLPATVSGFTGPVTYSVAGTVPAGVSFDSSTGAFTGPASFTQSLTKVVTGFRFSVALDTAGRVWAWGSNANGQLGDGTTTGRAAPALVDTAGTPMAGKTIVEVAAGTKFVIARSSDGQLFAWGQNASGQLGDGTVTDRSKPVAVVTSGTPMAGAVVSSVSAGDSHVLAVDANGTVYTWGLNGSGQLGDGTMSTRRKPVLVATSATPMAGARITQVAAANASSYALAGDGAVFSWGDNYFGQLGDNSTTTQLLPVAVYRGGALKGKVVTRLATSPHALVVFAFTSDGGLYGWGTSLYNQLTTNTTSPKVPAAISMGTSGLTTAKITSLAVGQQHVLALTSDGVVYAWGNNGNGQLGSGTTGFSATPAAVKAAGTGMAGKVVTSISAGAYHSIAGTSDGLGFGWGANAENQLGAGSTADWRLPAQTVGTGAPSGFPFTVTVTATGGGRSASSGPLTFTVVP